MLTPFLLDKNFLPDGVFIQHGFFGRQGGMSQGLYASLNCGAGTQDHPDYIHENRARVATEMVVPPDMLVTVRQVHSAKCLYVESPWPMDQRPEADAMVTDRQGLALGILTADCGPVLFYGEKENGQPVIGAAHAGWGGALRGVLESTVQIMLDHNVVQESIRVSIGPCIAQSSYEVSTDFMNPFLEENPESEHFFKSARRSGHLMFDLPGYIASRLARAGVRHVSMTGIDTYSSEENYFSYRRATHRGEKDYGRQISVIALPAGPGCMAED